MYVPTSYGVPCLQLVPFSPLWRTIKSRGDYVASLKEDWWLRLIANPCPNLGLGGDFLLLLSRDDGSLDRGKVFSRLEVGKDRSGETFLHGKMGNCTLICRKGKVTDRRAKELMPQTLYAPLYLYFAIKIPVYWEMGDKGEWEL